MGHEWFVAPADRLRGERCAECSKIPSAIKRFTPKPGQSLADLDPHFAAGTDTLMNRRKSHEAQLEHSASGLNPTAAPSRKAKPGTYVPDPAESVTRSAVTAISRGVSLLGSRRRGNQRDPRILPTHCHRCRMKPVGALGIEAKAGRVCRI